MSRAPNRRNRALLAAAALVVALAAALVVWGLAGGRWQGGTLFDRRTVVSVEQHARACAQHAGMGHCCHEEHGGSGEAHGARMDMAGE